MTEERNKRGGDEKSHQQGVKTVKNKYGDDFYKRIGQKGGKSQSKATNPGNFANRDPEDVKNAGRAGGKA